LEETCRLLAADGGLSDAMDMGSPTPPPPSGKAVVPALLGAAPAHRPGAAGGGDGGLRLVKALGVETGISKSEVSRICAELDRCGRTPDLLKERSRPGVGSGKSTLSRGPRAHPPCGEAGVVELAVAGGGKWAQPAGYTAAR
jgi:hypothetical protein